MKNIFIYLLLSCSMLSFISCEKDKDIDPITDSGSKEHYMPLSVGNSWTYDSEYYGEYTVSITGNKEINGKKYFMLANSLSSIPESYMRYEGNKLYVISTMGGKSIEALLVDEDAKEGQQWEAGKLEQSVPSAYSYTHKYTCKFVKFYETYTINGKTYDNVMEINLKTTIEDFTLGSIYTSMFDAEELALYKAQIENSLQQMTVNQTQFFAKGIGYVNQVSTTSSLLNIELKDYTIK